MVLDPRRFLVLAHPARELGPASFEELMAEQLRRAPWFLISVLAHATVILTLMMIPPDRATGAESSTIHAVQHATASTPAQGCQSIPENRDKSVDSRA